MSVQTENPKKPVPRLTEKQYFLAYQHWKKTHKQNHGYDFEPIDSQVLPFLSEDIKSADLGWLKKVRNAFLLSGGHVAEKMNISRAAYLKLEKNESLGTISINSLIQAAEAMDCELVYAIRPKKRQTFSKLIWRQLLVAAEKHTWFLRSPENTKSRALAFVAKNLMDSPSFRRQSKWTGRLK